MPDSLTPLHPPLVSEPRRRAGAIVFELMPPMRLAPMYAQLETGGRLVRAVRPIPIEAVDFYPRVTKAERARRMQTSARKDVA